MKKLNAITALGTLSFALAACGSAEDASTEASPDTVEMPAETALEPITEEPVVDTGATAPTASEVEGPAPVTQEAASSAADRAENVARQAEEAAAAAEAVDALDGLE